MKIRYDSDADAAYIYFMNEDTSVESTDGEWPFNVDIDKDGKVVGIEILDASKVLSKTYLQEQGLQSS